jgi:hypothetical protein
MSLLRPKRSENIVKLPNHTILYGLILSVVGVFVTLGSATRLYELREFFPLRLPDQVNEYILHYMPFIIGTFITTAAALAGVIIGLNWMFSGFGYMSRLKAVVRVAGGYYRPEEVSAGLKDGKLLLCDHYPSLLFLLIGRLWANARYVSQISGEVVRWNMRFIWKAVFIGVAIHFIFKIPEAIPSQFVASGLFSGYVIPSPAPFYFLLLAVCALKLLIALSLIPLRRPSASREMDSMIVEGKGHPALFFSILEEGSKMFAKSGAPNNILRTPAVKAKDGETVVGTLMESFPEYVRTNSKPSAYVCLATGSIMVLFGFLKILLMQYPTFSVGYEDFFRIHLLSLLTEIVFFLCVVLVGKGFLDHARAMLAIYRFRSSLVYVEAKGDFDKRDLPETKNAASPEPIFNPLSTCAFNVRYFSAEALSESVTPEGVRELVGLETSTRLAKDVGKLKFLPFQVKFVERYPSMWTTEEHTIDQSEDRSLLEAEIIVDSNVAISSDSTIA